MNGVLVVAAREIAERKRIFAAAAVASLLPFLTRLLPDVARGSAAEVRGFSALLLLAAFGIGTAAVLGSAVLARDLSERRAGFFFSRPLPALSIWGGKMLGAFLLAAGSALLCALPTILVSPRTGLIDRSLAPTGTWNLAGLFFGGLLFLVAFSHACSIALRSRSPWLAVDVVLLVVCALVITGSVLRLDRGGYRLPGLTAAAVLLGALPLLLAAGAASTAAGRTDLRRVHGLQSLVIWGTLVPLSLGGAAYAHWLLSPALSDVTAVTNGFVSPRGDWLAVVGRARGRGPMAVAFLMKSDASTSLRIPAAAYGSDSAVLFSPDGRFAWAFRQESGVPALWRLWRADLDAPRREFAPTQVTSDRYPSARISPSGRMMALLQAQMLSVVDLASEKTVAAVRSDAGAWGRTFFFPDDETIRIFQWMTPATDRTTTSLPLLEFRIRDKRIERTGAVARREGDPVTLRYERGGARVLALDSDRTRLRLLDGRTGEPLSVVSEGPRLNPWALPVPDGGRAPGTKGLRPLGFLDPTFAAPVGAGSRTEWSVDEKGALLRLDPATGGRTQVLPKPE
jgi:hypothetical protein